MMFTNLNASNYQYSDYFYNAEFEDLLSKIIRCYHLMIDDSVSLTNNENDIRDILLLNYLKNDSVRKKIGLVNYLFDREVPEDYSVRVDIDTSLSGKNKRQAHPIFGQITKNTTIILIYMGKIKGFLFAVRHREILMTSKFAEESN